LTKKIESLNTLIKELKGIERCKSRAVIIQKEITLEQSKLAELGTRVRKEYQDVKNLEEQSLKSLFATILKNKKEQLDKENQEYLLAVLEYNECKRVLEVLQYELNLLKSKMEGKSELVKEINHKISHLEEAEMGHVSYHISEIKAINTELKKISLLLLEADEAIDVTKELESHFTSMLHLLNKAQKHNGWGFMYHEKMEAKKKQKAYIDEAQSHMHIIKRLLLFLKNELNDVIDVHDKFKRSEVFIKSFNLAYYSNLIADWIKDENLKETMTCTKVADMNIKNLIKALRNLMTDAEKEYEFMSEKKKKLIAHLSTE